MTNVKYEDLVQTKDDLSNIIIYCPFNQIEINNEVLDCPNYPFSIEKENNITLLNTTYSGRKVLIREVIDMMHMVKEKVMLQLKPYPYTKLINENTTNGFSLIIALVPTIIIILYFCYKIFTFTLKDANRMDPNNELIDINR